MLDAAVFQRVEADDRRSTAGTKHVGKQGKRRVEVAKFIIDRDSKGLESPGRNVKRSPLAGDAPPHQFRELPRRGDLAQLPRLHDPPGDSSAVTLLAILVDDPREFFLVQGVHQIGRAGVVAVGIEPHVKRAVGREAEPPVRPRELIRRQSQVKQEPVDRIETQVGQDLFHLTVRSIDEGDGKPPSGLGGEGEHGRVAVDPDHPPGRSHTLGQSAGVPSGSCRSVHQHQPFPAFRGKPRHHLVKQDGAMHGGARRSVRGLGGFGAGAVIRRRTIGRHGRFGSSDVKGLSRSRSRSDFIRPANPVKAASAAEEGFMPQYRSTNDKPRRDNKFCPLAPFAGGGCLTAYAVETYRSLNGIGVR